MRRILIERSRGKLAARHGGGQERVDVDEIEITAPVEKDDELLAIHDALEKFAREVAAKAELVKLRFFAALTIEDAADVLGIPWPRRTAGGPTPAPGCIRKLRPDSGRTAAGDAAGI